MLILPSTNITQPTGTLKLVSKLPNPTLLHVGARGLLDNPSFTIGSASSKIIGVDGGAIDFPFSANAFIQTKNSNDIFTSPTDVTIIYYRIPTQAISQQSVQFGHDATSRVKIHLPWFSTIYFFWANSGNSITASYSPVIGKKECFAFTASTAGKQIWLNGELLASDAVQASRAADSSLCIIGGLTGFSAYPEHHYLTVVFPVKLPDSVVAGITRNPWSIFDKNQLFYFPVPNLVLPVAQFNVNLNSATFTGSAGTTAAAAFNLSTAAAIFTGSASVAPVAAFNIAMDQATFAGSALVAPDASFNVNLNSATFTGSAGTTAAASFNLATDATTFTGSASVAPVAAFNIALDQATFAGSALVAPVAAFNVNLNSAAFTGSAGTIIGASFNVTTDNALFSGGASAASQAAFNISLAAAAFSGSAVSLSSIGFKFASLLPSHIFTSVLGDEVVYHGLSGPVLIKAMVNYNISNVFASDAYVTEGRIQIDVDINDTPGIKRGSQFTIDNKPYTVDAVIDNDGFFARCLIRNG